MSKISEQFQPLHDGIAEIGAYQRELRNALQAAIPFLAHQASPFDRYNCDPAACPRCLAEAALGMKSTRTVYMTPSQKLQLIAKACGFTNVHPLVIRNVEWTGDDRTCGVTSDQGWILNYLTDLDAMHEAEKTLTDDQYERFRMHLWDIVTDGDKPRHNACSPTRFERAYQTIL